jgi:hypothetical protein
MKELVLLSIFAVLTLSGFTQQKVSTFQKAIEGGISIQTLDSLYKPALSGGADSLQAVFYGKHTEFQAQYIALLQAFGKHLKANNFSWGKKTRCFNRIYFNEHGTIDYFLFNFKPGELPIEKEQQFEKLLTTFIKDYKFPLPVQSKFAQCSPVTYTD